jgi:transposase
MICSAVNVKEDVMSKLLVPDELWALVEPLLPKHPYVPGVGKPRVDDRVCFTGILFLLKTGIPWEDFPQEMGCCGMTLHNRMAEWTRAGVWPKLHQVLLGELRKARELDLSRVIVDSSSLRAVQGGKKRDRARSTAAKTGRNTTSWSTPAASRWQTSSPPPTAMT